MKVLVGCLIVAASVVVVSAQDPVQPTQAAKANEAQKARVIAELTSAGSRMAFKNSPFSAEEVNESVQTLADGNRIVRSTTGKFYRNSEGRTRREMPGGLGGVMGSVYTTGQGVSIANPVAGQRYTLDTTLKTAQVAELKAAQGLSITSAPRALTEDQARAVNELKRREGVAVTAVPRALDENERITAVHKLTTELEAIKAPIALLSAQGVAGLATTITSAGGMSVVSPGFVSSKYDTRTEELGTRDFDGVSAEGTRKTTTIPAGAIGNERPIEIVYERWFSKDLGVVVYSRNVDPRFGEQTYKLINVVRAEPDPSLFSLPTGYKVTGQPTPVYNKLDTQRGVSAKPAVKTVSPVVYKPKFVD